jgi:hypothetical protein
VRAAFTVSFRRTSYLDAPFSGPFDKGWTVFSFRRVLDDLDEYFAQNILTMRQPPHPVPHSIAEIVFLHLFLARRTSPAGRAQDRLKHIKAGELRSKRSATLARTAQSTPPLRDKGFVTNLASFLPTNIRFRFVLAVHSSSAHSQMSRRLVRASMIRAVLALLACSRSGARMASSRPSESAFENARRDSE